MRYILMFSLLVLCSYFDLRTKHIPVILLVIYGTAGLIYYCLTGKISPGQEIGGVLIGVVLLLISRATREGIGYGDGLLLMVTGAFLGFSQNTCLLMAAFMLSALWSLLLLVLKKENRKKEIPFAPFLLLSYLGMVVMS